jgi:hypothetical protein
MKAKIYCFQEIRTPKIDREKTLKQHLIDLKLACYCTNTKDVIEIVKKWLQEHNKDCSKCKSNINGHANDDCFECYPCRDLQWAVKILIEELEQCNNQRRKNKWEENKQEKQES